MLGDLSNESLDPEGSLQHFTPTWKKGDLLPELSPQGLGNFGSSLSSGTLGVVELNNWLQKCSPVLHSEGSNVPYTNGIPDAFSISQSSAGGELSSDVSLVTILKLARAFPFTDTTDLHHLFLVHYINMLRGCPQDHAGLVEH